MRILISTDEAGGVGDHVRTLAGALAARGHAVLLALSGRAHEPPPPGVELVARDLRLEWMPGGLADVAATGEWLARLARAWQADVAHVNQLGPAGAVRFPCPVLVGAHGDVLSWYGETRGEAAPEEWGCYARAARAGLAAAAAVVAPSAHQSRLLRRHYGRAADRVIWNGAEPPPASAQAWSAPACPGEAPVLVLTVGRAWDEAKGAAVLDRALRRLGAAAPRAVLLGALRGPVGESFVPRALEAPGRVPRAEVERWLARADFYVGPSLYEPFGLAPLEAALHGRALLLSELPSFRELWEGTAVFTPAGDDAALASAIEALAADPDRRRGLGRAAWARARARYGVGRMTRAYLELYAGLAAARATAGATRPARAGGRS